MPRVYLVLIPGALSGNRDDRWTQRPISHTDANGHPVVEYYQRRYVIRPRWTGDKYDAWIATTTPLYPITRVEGSR